MKDRFGRQITYLRISVIDKCNLRCVYCLPHGVRAQTAMEALLTDEELVALAEIFVELGITKIRLTGGEPLLRPGCVELVRRLAQMSGVRELAMSTNGVLLARQAAALKHAGLQRVNVSLDTVSRERFQRITGVDGWDHVVRGLRAARDVGLTPVKVNVVLMNGVNDDEVLDLVAFAVDQGVDIRFIEWMPTTGLVDHARASRFLSTDWAQARIAERYPLIPDVADPHAPARSFRLAGTASRVGFISPLSTVFCAACNRVRLKATGQIKTCLHGPEELDLKAMLRTGVPHEAIARRIATTVFLRPEQHSLNDTRVPHRDFVMTQVGG